MSTIFKKLLWRSGLSTQLAKSKLLPGEAAVTTDDNKAYICTSSGHVEQLATHEQLANILDSSADAYQAMLTLLDTFEDNPSQLTTILNAISTLTSGLANANSNISDNSAAITQNSNAIAQSSATITQNSTAITQNSTAIADMKDGTKDGSLQKQINDKTAITQNNVTGGYTITNDDVFKCNGIQFVNARVQHPIINSGAYMPIAYVPEAPKASFFTTGILYIAGTSAVIPAIYCVATDKLVSMYLSDAILSYVSTDQTSFNRTSYLNFSYRIA